jgi:HEAT repeat protein
MDDIEELVKKMGDPDPKVKRDAAWYLGTAAHYGADITIAISALTDALSDKNSTVRWNAAGALYLAARYGADITAAIPALTEAVSDADVGVRTSAATALYHAARHGTDVTVAISALTDALSDKDANVRWNAAGALKNAVENCASVERLNVIEVKLREGYGALRSKYLHWREDELARAGSELSYMLNEAAKKKNGLARGSRDGLLLDDKPKPPKKGGVYQEMRRVRNG